MQFIHFCGKGFVIKCNREESECILPYFGLDVATMWLSYFAKKKIKKKCLDHQSLVEYSEQSFSTPSSRTMHFTRSS